MRRRDFIISLAGAPTALPLRARAQSIPVLGYVSVQSAAAGERSGVFDGLRRGLSDMGFDIGRNLKIEYRWADWDAGHLPALVASLVKLRVSAIYANGAGAGAAAKATTTDIPIVFFYGGDPVQDGLVASLARPGGNVTGVTLLSADLGPKRLELLRELLPGQRVFGMLTEAGNVDAQAELNQIRRAAKALGQDVRVVSARTEAEFDPAFRTAVDQHCTALLVGTGGLFSNNLRHLLELTQRYRLPAMFDRRSPVDAGGLIGYGTDFAELGHRAGILIGRVLKGQKPADMPVEQPTKFELVINLKTAKALSLTVPQLILARADEVIE